jgi:ABC-type nitrate/sulfonate/bicarbonate transport system substrate-binding protein
MKGLEFAFNNPEEAVDIVLKYAPDENREHQRFMLSVELADAVGPVTEENGLGWMTEEQWRAFHDFLTGHEALAKPIDVTKVYTDRFLKEIYDRGELKWP